MRLRKAATDGQTRSRTEGSCTGDQHHIYIFQFRQTRTPDQPPAQRLNIKQSQYLSILSDKETMKNSNSLFVVFCLCLTVGLLAVYVTFLGHFNGRQEFEIKLTSLQKEVDQERLQNSRLSYQIKDFQQSVAQLMPAENKLIAKYDLKTFSAVVRSPASDAAIDLSGVLFERGKRYFNNQDYDRAIKEFQNLGERYPLSRHSVESRFFVAESYFLKRDFRSSLTEIDEMVTQYPSHELTGFILLRMGQISEINNQTEEASEIYKTVLKNFKNEILQKQATKLAKNVEFE